MLDDGIPVILRFQASQAVVADEDGAIVVALEGDGHYLLLQRSKSDTGTGQPYVEIDDQLHGGYGLIESCALDCEFLELMFRAQIESLPGIDGCKIDVTASGISRNALAEGIYSVFKLEPSRFRANV